MTGSSTDTWIVQATSPGEQVSIGSETLMWTSSDRLRFGTVYRLLRALCMENSTSFVHLGRISAIRQKRR